MIIYWMELWWYFVYPHKKFFIKDEYDDWFDLFLGLRDLKNTYKGIVFLYNKKIAR